MKIHLGCGDKFIPGFVHVDIRPLPNVDIISPADNLGFVDNSAELIYACHILEHFGRNDTVRVLKEWNRVLCPGGVLRLSVPDFDAIVTRYRKDRLPELLGLLYGKQDYEYNFHKVVFNFKTLEKALTESGFNDVKRYKWQLTGHAHIDDYSQAYLPHMDKEFGQLMSLNVEAIKV